MVAYFLPDFPPPHSSHYFSVTECYCKVFIYVLLQLVVLALKCLSRLLLRDLPSMKEESIAENILNSVFTLLGKYSLSGTTTKNEELVMAATKVFLVALNILRGLFPK